MTVSTGGKTTQKKWLGNGKWGWFHRIFYHPGRVFSEMAEVENQTWLKPMLILTIMVILLSLISGPARLNQAQMNLSQPPDDFIYWSEEQQTQFFESQAAMQGPLFIYIFPLLGSLAGLWLGWFILGSIMHLLMTFKGSRQPQESYLNLVAWSALPFAVRSLVQIIAVLTTQRVIENPGLSGFIANVSGNWQILLQILLGLVDIYALGFLALLILGAPHISGLKNGKALWMAVLAVGIFIALISLPQLLLKQLGGMGTIRPFFFF